MENLLTLIAELHQMEWDYYYSHENNYILKPFIDDINHDEFIKRYFKRSGKEQIFKKYFNVNYSLLNHSMHTNSIFFLGLLISRNTKIKNCKILNNHDPNYSLFPFIWFLTCLFHDMGYDYEKSQDKKNVIWDIDSLKKELKIKYDFLNQSIYIIPETITETIGRYFIWKRVVRKEIDHGIVAGFYLYDKLVKNRKNRYRKNDSELFWAPELDIQYAQVAATIASHNIWFTNTKTNTEKSYKDFNLEQLVEHPLIKLEESPLLFLLGLVDSIDPIKIFYNKNPETSYDPEFILSNTNIEFTNNSLKLVNGNIRVNDFEKLIDRCNGLKLWLDVMITVCDNSVEIEFK